MKKLMKRFKNERGLTLVELLAVIVILAIVSTIAFVLIGNVIENSKKDTHITNAQQLIDSAKLYDVDQGFEDSVTDETLRGSGLLDKFINPWDANADYEGTVTKVEEEVMTYKVKITGGKDCAISDATEVDLAQGHDAICTD